MKYLSPLFLYGGDNMTEYQRERKLLRDYLSRQRRKGMAISVKLPKAVKHPTQKSVEKIATLREQAKQQAKTQRIKLKEQERIRQEFAKTPVDKIYEDMEHKESSPMVDLETGEIVFQRPKQEPDYDFDTYQNLIDNTIYDWANDGTQTEFSERIISFIKQCISIYGTEKVAEALQIALDRNMVLSKLEKYNDVYCHAWITLFQDILSEIGQKFPEDVAEEYDRMMYDANEDQFNGELDAEVYQRRYTSNG